MIGRWLCRIGRHRWSYHVGVDAGPDAGAIATVARCARTGCPRNGTMDLVMESWQHAELRKK